LPPDQARRLIVTLDGPAGAGKSTLAKRLARRLDLLYLDSGAFYRAVALMAGQHQGDLLSPEWLSSFLATFQLRVSPGPDGLKLASNGQDITAAIREPLVSQGASLVATLRPVRQWVHEQLANLASAGGVIAEGRDMGTRVFPEADVKIYLAASLEVRAHRRWLELQAQGKNLDENNVCQDMALRDQRDQERQEDPLRIPARALVIDSTIYTLDQVEEICLGLIQPYV
jgi:cytidylate kinase